MPVELALNRMLVLKRGSYDYEISAICSGPCSSDQIICPETQRTVFLTADGKLAPCISIAGISGQQKHFADLSGMSFRRALEDSPYSACVLQTLGDYFAKNPDCGACPYRQWCRGGCRAEALEFDENDYLGVERHRCEFFREGFTDRILKRMSETVPQARCVNLPEDFPHDPALWQPPKP